MAKSILKPGGIKAVVNLLIESFSKCVTDLVHVGEMGSGEVRARFMFAGDAEGDDQGKVSFHGRATTPVVDVVGGEVGVGLEKKRTATTDASVVIEIEMKAIID